MNPLHTSTTYFSKTHHNIILSFTFKSPSGFFHASFWSKSCMHSMHNTCPVHLIFLDLLSPTICGTVKRQNVCIVIKSMRLTEVKKQIVLKHANQTVYLFRWLLQWGYGTAQPHNISTSGTREMVFMGPYPFTQCGAKILNSTVRHGIPSPASWLQTATKPSSWRSCGSGCQNWQQHQLLHGCKFLLFYDMSYLDWLNLAVVGSSEHCHKPWASVVWREFLD